MICWNKSLKQNGSFSLKLYFAVQADMNIEMKKVNEKINHIEELMTTFISQLAAKGLQTPSENIEVIHFNSKNRSDWKDNNLTDNMVWWKPVSKNIICWNDRQKI